MDLEFIANNIDMKYYFSKKLTDVSFEQALQKVEEALQAEGFGVLTDINVQATFKKKLDVDFQKYRILGACHAPSAHRALQAEDKVGTMLPCNVIVQELEDGRIEVAAINPIASMQAVENETLGGVATEVTKMLKRVVEMV